MKNSLKFYIGSIIVVSIFFLNFAFNGVNSIVLGKFNLGGSISAFDQYDNANLFMNISLDQVDEFVDVAIKEADNHQVILFTAFTPIDSENKDLYLYGHSKYNELLDFYLPYKPFDKIDYQGEFVLNYDNDNSSLHKDMFFLDHKISIKSYDQLKVDELEFFYNVKVYGNQADIQGFIAAINDYYGRDFFEHREYNAVEHGIFSYIVDSNKSSLSLLIVSFLMMFYFAINLVKHQSDEISVRKLVGQSDWHISLGIMKKISVVSLVSVLLTCIAINLLFVRSLNFVLWMMLLMELILVLFILFFLLLCFFFIYGFTKNTSIVQIVRVNKNYIKGFAYYQVLKTAILVIIISQFSSVIRFGLNDLTEYMTLKNNYEAMSHVSYLSGFKSNDSNDYIIQREYESVMEEYVLENKDVNIHTMSVGYFESQGNNFSIIYMDLNTANYYGFDCEDKCVLINDKVYNRVNTSEYSMDELVIIDKNYSFTPIKLSSEITYQNPIIVIGDPNELYKYYMIEDDVGSVDKFKSVVESFDNDAFDALRISPQQKIVDTRLNMLKKGVDRLLLESICLALIIIIMSISLVELYYNAYKTKLSVLYVLGKSNMQICKEVVITDILIYAIVWMILNLFFEFNVISGVIIVLGVIVSCLINKYLLLRMIKKELMRTL